MRKVVVSALLACGSILLLVAGVLTFRIDTPILSSAQFLLIVFMVIGLAMLAIGGLLK